MSQQPAPYGAGQYPGVPPGGQLTPAQYQQPPPPAGSMSPQQGMAAVPQQSPQQQQYTQQQQFQQSQLQFQQTQAQHRAQLQLFWQQQMTEIEQVTEFKNAQLPFARIKKIMKADEDVRMISAEAPVLFAKACEMFILELTLRSWIHTEENKRRTLQRNDIAAAITKTDIFDFLVDIVPRDDLKDLPQEEGLALARPPVALPGPGDQMQYGGMYGYAQPAAYAQNPAYVGRPVDPGYYQAPPQARAPVQYMPPQAAQPQYWHQQPPMAQPQQIGGPPPDGAVQQS
ncbi:CCAAT-binding factor subunit C [Klebsormidium nitens]|uniref:CCAAT-binding factor subunit C n=1 Tax=Klebsormidium nitens TaxID=105231 RepID=A0A1Y1IN37_KLENI|nr:CCAAT-binding factor subunit C [Klebsormidium nitens]|eukprot:GAQ90027.1 CCAAT-binding factor subunit C [Klebsormidium nitens]